MSDQEAQLASFRGRDALVCLAISSGPMRRCFRHLWAISLRPLNLLRTPCGQLHPEGSFCRLGATSLDSNPVGRILSLADLVLPTIRYGSIGEWTRTTMRKPVIWELRPDHRAGTHVRISFSLAT